MNYLYVTDKKIIFKSFDGEKEILPYDLIHYLDMFVFFADFSVEDLFDIMKGFGDEFMDISFKRCMRGLKFKDIREAIYQNTSKQSIKTKLEYKWHNYLVYDNILQHEKLLELYLPLRYNIIDEEYNSSEYSISDILYSKIELKTEYETYHYDEDGESVTKFHRYPNLRLIIEGLLREITMYSTEFKDICASYSDFKSINDNKLKEETDNRSDVMNAKLKIIELQEKLEYYEKNQEFEKCSEVLKEIEICNKIINGK